MIFFVSDMFAEQYKGGGELTTEAIISKSLFPVNKILAHTLTVPLMEGYKDVFWIFGNFSAMSDECIMYAVKNLKYSVIEYDYKFCIYRSPKKHILAEGQCNCATERRGKLVSIFLQRAKATWWMSHNQLNKYQKLFPFLKNNQYVLSSVFADETLALLDSLDTSDKEDRWIILNSPSWIKGAKESIEYAESNNLPYELVWDVPHDKLLEKLAKTKGIVCFPQDSDTCPRMTIEAKLLDCEMICNENVQHRDEPWFESKETILPYLESQIAFFWSEIEKLAQSATNTPAPPIDDAPNSHQFKIVVPFYNAEKWIHKCIQSLQQQRYRQFECLLIDDLSTDGTSALVKQLIEKDARFKLKENTEKKYALQNIVEGIAAMECQPEDVIILLDGDDWLSSTHTLSHLATSYKDSLMTYGSYVFHPHGFRGPEPSEYSPDVIDNNAFRQDKWRASHLRTFKYKLWEHLKLEDLKDKEGNYYQMTYDQAIMLPLLELAGAKSQFIPEVLHVYNKENPLNVDKIKAQKQTAIAQEIRSKVPYERL